jgi:hypothetical protein
MCCLNLIVKCATARQPILSLLRLMRRWNECAWMSTRACQDAGSHAERLLPLIEGACPEASAAVKDARSAPRERACSLTAVRAEGSCCRSLADG